MTLLLVDYSWARPSPTAIRSAGYSGVMRYLSPDPTKNLTPEERDRLFAAGLSIGLVWEATSARAGQGLSAGSTDAAAANAQAAALGYPAWAPIFFAVDYDAVPATIQPYFAGVTSASHHPVGVYGGIRVVEALDVPFKWQACAWSGGAVSSQAHLYQRLKATVGNPIPATDENVVCIPFPLWTHGLTPPPAQDKPPASTTAPAGDINVNILDFSKVTANSRTWVRGNGVGPLQSLLQIRRDGLGGPGTRGALVDAQRHASLKPDAVFGPISASAFLAGR